MEVKFKIKRLLKIWLKMARMVILPDLVNPGAILLFVTGKVVRMLFYFTFLFSVTKASSGFLGYSKEEVILFFLVFIIVDSITQLIFRGVYVFRPLLIRGDFDLDLLKPYPSYFRPVFGRFDLADFITFFPFVVFSFWFMLRNNLIVWENLVVFVLLLAVSLLLGFAFHLFVCSVGVLTLEIDHLIWVYRDLTSMARFPTDIYSGLIKFLLTFVIPVIILITFPAKGLLGLLSFSNILLAVLFALVGCYLSLKFWFWSLKKYGSASS